MRRKILCNRFLLFFSFLQVTTLTRDMMSQESIVLCVIMFKDKRHKVKKIIHEVLAEIYCIIKHSNNCSRCNIIDYKPKCISYIGLIK